MNENNDDLIAASRTWVRAHEGNPLLEAAADRISALVDALERAESQAPAVVDGDERVSSGRLLPVPSLEGSES